MEASNRETGGRSMMDDQRAAFEAWAKSRDILPCPFCGGEDIDVAEGTTFRWRQARCRECGASSGEVRIQTFGSGTPEQWEAKATADAVVVWNRRIVEE